jgi:thioesterase DpgC
MAPPGAQSGEFGLAAARLGDELAAGNQRVASFPPRPQRDKAQQAEVEKLLDRSRKARDQFINAHAEAVYDELTANRAEHPRLDELVYAAADRFPGLVPTRDQLEHEYRYRLADRDASEVDQGIFFRGLLRSPTAGRHLVESMLLPSPRARGLRTDFARAGRLDLGTVAIECSAGVAWLTVNNQRCLNAEDNRLIDDMETAVDLALLDEQVRVTVLRGGVMTHPRYQGRRVFSAGINLDDLRDGKISFVDFLLRREFGYINKIARGILHDEDHRYPYLTGQKPWIAAVDAFAIGGGMQLLMVFDRVIAADDVFFSLPAAHEGIVPGAANLRLSQIAGPRLARRMILGGQVLRAADPQAMMLCDEVVPARDMDEAVDRSVRDFGQEAVAANRRMINLAEESVDDFRRYMAEFSYLQAVRMYSGDVIAKLGRPATVQRGSQ